MKQQINEFKRMQLIAGLITESEYRESQMDEAEMDEVVKTNWNDLDWDFSDSDSVNFGNFEVDINQFKKGLKNGYVIDDNGVKRGIDKATIESILQSYKENW
jgi:hypothetical protein